MKQEDKIIFLLKKFLSEKTSKDLSRIYNKINSIEAEGPTVSEYLKDFEMEATFKSDDPVEIKRLAKATDMASCLWEIVHNGWREFKHTDYDYERAWDKIGEILDEHNIDVDDLYE